MSADTRKQAVEKIVKRVTGRVDDDVVATVLKGLSRGYDRRKLRDRLGDKVKDASKAAKIIERVFEETPLLAAQNDSRKRPKFEEFPSGFSNGAQKKKVKVEDGEQKTAPRFVGATAVASQDLKVKELMAEAQRAIEERKKKLHMPTASLVSDARAAFGFSSKLAPAEAEQFMQQALDKAHRATELKAKIAARLPAALANAGAAAAAAEAQAQVEAAAPVVPPRAPTLKANIRAEKRQLFQIAKIETEKPAAVAADAHVDSRVIQKSAARPTRKFVFHEKGEFEQLANRQRAKAKLERLQSEISQAAKKTGISSAVKLAMVAPKQTDIKDVEVPSVEWWDQIVLPSGANYELAESADADAEFASLRTISCLIEHPIQLKPPDEPTQQQYLRVFLTKKEQKKLRRQNRKETQREKTEKIRLGLEPPPEPKVKISNLMRVLGAEAVQDPTKMEAHVRDQVAKRLRKHVDENQARKLSKDQRTAKKMKKVQEDTALGVHVTVYRISELTNASRKFKVEMNAKQLAMTGVIVLHKDVNVVVIEGGPKQQKFMKRLMLHRIKWAEDASKKGGVAAKCELVWEGIVKKRNFGDMRVKTCPLEKQCRELFEKHSVAHYWDMAYSGAILAQDEPDLLA